MIIVKTISGNVLLKDNKGNIQKVLINVNSLEAVSKNEIIVKYGFNQWTGIIVDKVTATQVEPNAEISFSGDINDLIAFLSSDFFFDVNGGSPSPSDSWNYIIKNTSQDVTNSDTLTDDTDFKFNVKAGAKYMIEIDAVISANDTNGDYKNGFTVGFGTIKGVGIVMANGTGSNANLHNIDAYTTTATNHVAIGTAHSDLDYLHSIKIIFSFTPNANTVFKYQFANNNAGVGHISRTWKGSILKWKQLN